MPAKTKTVGEYLAELRETRKDKPEQVRQALEIYEDLWARVVEKGIASESDGIDEALSKIDAKGGLYQAASD